jgi:hypothetical protein
MMSLDVLLQAAFMYDLRVSTLRGTDSETSLLLLLPQKLYLLEDAGRTFGRRFSQAGRHVRLST